MYKVLSTYKNYTDSGDIDKRTQMYTGGSDGAHSK